MFKLTILESKQSIEVAQQGKELLVNQEATMADVCAAGQGRYLIYTGHKVVEIFVLKHLPAERKYVLLINGRKTEVVYETKLDLLLKSMGFEQSSKGKAKNLTAPMPGMILDIKVAVGQRVAAGDPILVLEAMKMENVLKVTAEAVVKELKVRVGDKVDKNQVLVVFE